MWNLGVGVGARQLRRCSPKALYADLAKTANSVSLLHSVHGDQKPSRTLDTIAIKCFVPAAQRRQGSSHWRRVPAACLAS